MWFIAVNDPEYSTAARLILQGLQISQVRNLNNVDLQLARGINVFHGANGAGKTSILEAIYILAQGKTFRHGRSENWIQHGRDQASVIIEYSKHHGAAEAVSEVKTALPTKRLGLIRGRQHWQARHDGEELQSYAQLSALLPVVLFQPYSHQLVEAGPEYRRQFLDWGVFHVEPEYLVSWRRYQKALKQRNASLKAQSSDAVIAAIDPVLAQAAQQLHAQRQRFFSQFQPHYQYMQQLLGGDFEPIDLAYEPGFPHPDTLQEDWLQSLEKDRQRGFTLLGPHRADISLRTSQRGARGWLSRGQQKMVALAMLLAKLQVWQQDAGKGAVLLLDDVQSELDGYHLQQLLQLLVLQQQQVLITGTSAALGEAIAAKRFHVEQGQIKAQ
jgi:DNA replication and repair protein RecF